MDHMIGGQWTFYVWFGVGHGALFQIVFLTSQFVVVLLLDPLSDGLD